MKYIRLAGLLLCTMILQGCLIGFIFPFPTFGSRASGSRVEREQLCEIEPGVATKQDVVALLGTPAIDWQTENIFIYSWEKCWIVMPWFFMTFVGEAGGDVEQYTSKHYLLVQFTPSNQVERLECCTRSLFESPGELFEEWVRENE